MQLMAPSAASFRLDLVFFNVLVEWTHLSALPALMSREKIGEFMVKRPGGQGKGAVGRGRVWG